MIYFMILAMIFAHIVDDWVLQGKLANFKQRSWWLEVAPDDLYKHDYIMAMAIHSMSWSFMIHLPLAWIWFGFDVNLAFVISFAINAAIHGYVDHLKANCHKINLVTDQLIHLAQILVTAAFFLFFSPSSWNI